MTNLTFRPFDHSEADYQAVVGVHNIAMPDYIDEVSDWREWDKKRPDFCKFERWVAERDGAIVAFASFEQFAGMYHPQKFNVDVCVAPEFQGKGLAQRLYGLLLERLAPHNPTTLRSEAREDFAAAQHLLRKFGFEEEMRFWESRLNVTAFDPSPWADHVEQVRAKGVEIITLRDLMNKGDDFRPALYEAMIEMNRDVPRPDEYTPLAFEQWVSYNLENPNVLPDGYFLAMHQGNIAGVSNLWKASEEHVLHTGLTATRRDYRRMGIALALKLRAIDYARHNGITEIRTGNESRNRAMLSINEALGFAKQPIWVAFARSL
jgi:GNAT superfamily N-acetyltransferase